MQAYLILSQKDLLEAYCLVMFCHCDAMLKLYFCPQYL